jgi:hypothetical protein
MQMVRPRAGLRSCRFQPDDAPTVRLKADTTGNTELVALDVTPARMSTLSADYADYTDSDSKASGAGRVAAGR